MKVWYQVVNDYNLKCKRLYVQDGAYGKDLGPLTGTDEAIAEQIERILDGHSLIFYNGQAEWVLR